jgi:hypothetical protein
VTYIVNGRTVVASADTQFKGGACASVKPGKDVQIEGVELADRSIRANVVTKK